MKQWLKSHPSAFFVCVILLVFVGLLIVNETSIFRNHKVYTFEEAYEQQLQNGVLHTKSGEAGFVEATHEDIKHSMKIKHTDSDLMYMDLSEPVNMSEAEVNEMLKGSGILEGQGKVFLEAQKRYEVNVIYLVSHAQLETGQGQSELAQGIQKGNQRYYNFFGIGAFDRDAIKTGTSYAMKAKWTSPEKAIMGGAEFVRQQYFENGQLTLYQMRWNPQAPGTHQYASDVDWATRIAQQMAHYYKSYGIKKERVLKDYYVKN
ncbi:N-acetylglucosaminidase [Staphylococcus americanisciuri]|uniref:N-acetylglucosaminidase n=1 Tax=Staphylococcus americanisciuri TaxID=2973940 RepID=A0ABT2F194_9STAP|nr:N-acetylglucosaminidase [Staphylococcus americanisciuri]MCS4486041.1 N-acetylglucosaminidase [Staphylococcus americanisciuri]